MKNEKPPKQDPLYVCPMHPGERSNERGRCGICHMFLEKIQLSSLDSPAWYYCPDHPEPQYTEPGKCMRCGREFQRSKP